VTDEFHMTEVALFDDGFAAPCVLHASGQRTQHRRLKGDLNVCFWHKADIRTRSANVCFWG
jgi:hypothetical protein